MSSKFSLQSSQSACKSRFFRDNQFISIIKMLNNIIRHLNAGRHANAEKEIPEFAEANIPSDLELSKQNQLVTDYMDNDIKEHWDFYITKKLQTYMEKRYEIEDGSSNDG